MSATRTTRLLAALAAVGFVTVFAHAAYAQEAAVSRADVIAETRAANMAGELWVGEIQPAPTLMASTRSREQRKAETRAANTNGGLGNNGAKAYYPGNREALAALASSTKTRADRKAETMQAIRDHKLTAPGEGIGTSVH
jgi:hypothetical protein